MAKISTVIAIPIMTSNTAPSGISSASSADASFPAYLAFNGVFNATGWRGLGATNQWLRYDFPIAKAIAKYSLSTTVVSRAVKNFTFEGSSDGSSWTVLDTRTNITTWVIGVKQEFVLDPTKVKNYKMYRVNCSANNGDASYTDISELEMFELVYSNKFLISSGDEYYSIENMYKDNAIPDMTSNTSPSGVAEASSTFSTFYPWRAFDRIVDQNGWVSASGVLVGWLSYEFPSTVTITGYSIKSGTTPANRLPKNWTFEGWDGVKWIVLDSRVNEPNFAAEEFRFYGSKNKIAYKKYRINVTANQGAGDFLSIGDLGMYELDKYISSVDNSETSFLEHGMEKGVIIDLEDEFIERKSVVKDHKKIGSGKVFKQKIDTAKIPIKKASIT
ncbi:discoidin domain-containing protein [Paenibacillus sp. FSL K6-1318]|uniref:discoidin domain-containing protein n=1 Tax=Paenibacillus sp. FSL K6-1318 TaxID=2975291 RepID=UPI0030EDCABD